MSPSTSDDDGLVEGVPVLTKYEFAEVPIPDDFLTTTPSDAKPITFTPVDWAATPLPGNAGAYAVVLDHVISPSECAQLLTLAEASVPAASRGQGARQFWKPALVNVGGGFEALDSSYRNSDRIIWDQQTVMDRLWARCVSVPAVAERLAVIESPDEVLANPRNERRGGRAREGQRWEFRRLNKRMRFLKYGPGQFFRAHNDGAYQEPGADKIVKTLFTVHLYLNDSVAEAEPGAEGVDLVGGATSFVSPDETRRVDVDPKAGRVLIFQHRALYHCGDEVKEGVKYTMRTDIMYELMRTEDLELFVE